MRESRKGNHERTEGIRNVFRDGHTAKTYAGSFSRSSTTIRPALSNVLRTGTRGLSGVPGRRGMTFPGGMQVRFWGVRGSMPTPSAETLGYGGNTSCVEIRLPGHPSLIFDAGTGIHQLGLKWGGEDAHIFLTHFHWDHIGGIPFFSPLYRSGQQII